MAYDAGEGELSILPELPVCPAVQTGMRNQDLAAIYIECRHAFDQAFARVWLWEQWVEIERGAHERLSDGKQ